MTQHTPASPRSRTTQLCLPLALGLAMALAACSKSDQDNASNTLDNAVARGQDIARDAQAKAAEAAANAKTAAQSMGGDLQVAARNAASEARAAASAASTNIQRGVQVVGADVNAALGRARLKAEDEAITSAVSAALAKDTTFTALEIKTETKDGVVTITGAVPNEGIRQRAADVAGRATGVKSVTNDLTVRS